MNRDIADGVYAWMAEHPISVQGAIVEGVKQWCDEHKEEILAAISKAET